MKAGDTFENPITGEYGYLRIGAEETNGELLVADLKVRVGGAVAGEHLHPTIEERFTVLSGKIGYRIDGKEGIANAGETLNLHKGIRHDWWNAGDEEARVIVQVKPAARFEQMITTTFGLAKEGKTNAKGMPNMLQLAVIGKEFGDVAQFMNPPVWIQNIMFSLLAPLGRMLGYKATYVHHKALIQSGKSVKVEPLPEHIKIDYL